MAVAAALLAVDIFGSSMSLVRVGDVGDNNDDGSIAFLREISVGELSEEDGFAVIGEPRNGERTLKLPFLVNARAAPDEARSRSFLPIG